MSLRPVRRIPFSILAERYNPLPKPEERTLLLPVAAVRKLHFKQAWWSVAPVLKCLPGNFRVPGNSLSLIKTKPAACDKACHPQQGLPPATKPAVCDKACRLRQSPPPATKPAVCDKACRLRQSIPPATKLAACDKACHLQQSMPPATKLAAYDKACRLQQSMPPATKHVVCNKECRSQASFQTSLVERCSGFKMVAGRFLRAGQ